jgi:cyclase
MWFTVAPPSRARRNRFHMLSASLLLVLNASSSAQEATAASDIELLQIRANVFVAIGAGANTTVQTGSGGLLLVDTKTEGSSDALIEAIRSSSKQPIRYIVNTSPLADHAGGNERIARTGSQITGGNVAAAIRDAAEGAAVIAHENVLNRMVADGISSGAWPTETYINAHRDLFFNGEAVQIFHRPNAITDGDSIVFFRRSDVVAVGDLFDTTSYPYIDTTHGGTINGVIDALNFVVDLTVPEAREEAGTLIVSGHGRVADEADVVEYRDMLTIVRDRVQNLIENGATLRKVLEAKPTADYDPRYSADGGDWTTKDFIEAVYLSLTAEKG